VVRRAIDIGTIEGARGHHRHPHRTSDVHVCDPQISEATQGRVSGWSVAHPTLRRFLDLVFVGQLSARGTTAPPDRGARAMLTGKSRWNCTSTVISTHSGSP
jgi:hypothetical protein